MRFGWHVHLLGPLILQRHLSHTDGLTCGNATLREGTVAELRAPDVQI